MTKADIAHTDPYRYRPEEEGNCRLMEAVFTLMKNTFESGETLKISRFGTFELKQKEDQRGRNPQTGEAITIEARRVLTFKPSHVLRNAINK